MYTTLALIVLVGAGTACPRDGEAPRTASPAESSVPQAPPPTLSRAAPITQSALASMLKAPLTPRRRCAEAPVRERRFVDLEVWAGPDVTRGALTRTLARLGAWGLSANVQFRIVGDLVPAAAGPLVPPPAATPIAAARPPAPQDTLAKRLGALARYFAPRTGAAETANTGDAHVPVRLVLTTALYSGRDPVQRVLGEGAGLGLCPSCPRDADSEALFLALGAKKSAPGAAFVNVKTATRDTAAHELGHAMGLMHHPERTHLMHPTPHTLCAPVLDATERARYGHVTSR